jgi:signal transduction histidine kinase
MSEVSRGFAPHDPKGRLVSIFVGAVLLPSVALSVVSFHAVPRQAEATKIMLMKRAERVLYYIEEDLERTARAKALEAARVVGAERLLDGRAEVAASALREAGMAEPIFETLRLEPSLPMAGLSAILKGDGREVEVLQEALTVVDPRPGPEGEESLALSGGDSKLAGMLRFRFTCGYAHGTLLREYFEKDFSNPDQAMVVRVTEPEGTLLYENAASPDDRFEVKRVMSAPSFKGLKLFLRYKDRSIQDEVRRWALAKTVLIGFIDLMLGAGLYLTYTNVRREVHLSRLKSDFVANVSHELKTPLALIRLFAETLELGRVPGEDKKREYYHVINKESQRLTTLINNVLDFSRIEAGRKEYRFEPTDIARVVDEVLEAYRFTIEQQGFALDVRVAEDLPGVEVDKEAIGQALVNLVNNAIKYSRDEKSIRIRLEANDGRLLLSVADRGIGIARSEQKKIFEKFYRAEDSLVHETKGSGLGLALVRHIMEAHGGDVEVESAPGSGSTFTLVLPIKKVNA